MTRLVFRHCLSIVLYKLRLCSTSSLVQISCCLLVVFSSRPLVITSLSLYPCPLKFHLPSRLPHLTFLSIPPKLTLDLELRNRTILDIVPGCRPLLGSHSKSIQLVPKRIEYRPPLSSPNPRSFLGLTQCRLVSTSTLHPPLIGSK